MSNSSKFVWLVGSIIVGFVAWWFCSQYLSRQNEIATNSFRQVAVAMLNYEYAERHLPNDIVAKQEKQYAPLLSWRVSILPYFEEDALYKRFALDEPWDSPTNLAAAKDMPRWFTRPGLNLEEGMTVVQRPIGAGSMFPTREPGKRFVDVDSRKNRNVVGQTIMLVETTAENAVFWTKPADYQYDESDPAKGLGAKDLFFISNDAGAWFIRKSKARDETLKAFFSPDETKIPGLDSWQSRADGVKFGSGWVSLPFEK